ncbi:MAG: hypothetical protein CMN76_02580 [Spirochaetaceae bacterium]|nr:hypothetical protein [Spirochaetaceae bacterium]|tara:strand:- start:29815 stop:30234 length:420 start_codon:yes stop_codon:yes gene_type:complete
MTSWFRCGHSSILLLIILISMASAFQGPAHSEEPIPSYFSLPQGAWEEQNGTAILKISAGNVVDLSFTGVPGRTCKLEVYGRLRSEYTARPGQCVHISYQMLRFAFQGKELILTLVNPGENFRELIFVPEGSQKDAPDI